MMSQPKQQIDRCKQKVRQKSTKRPSFFPGNRKSDKVSQKAVIFFFCVEHFMGVKTEWRNVLFRLFVIVQYTIQKLVNKF